MKILHFCYDDKFIPFIQQTFEEALPGCSEFRTPGNPAQPPRFMIAGPHAKVKAPDYWQSDEVIREMENFDCLVIHFMLPIFYHALAHVPKSLLVQWVGWGIDYYHFVEPYMPSFYLPKTAFLMKNRQKPLRLGITQEGNKRQLSISTEDGETPDPAPPPPPPAKHTRMHDLVENIDLMSIMHPHWPDFLKAFPKFKGGYQFINTFSAESVFAPGPDRMQGPDILLGNSATASNNHLELFDILLNMDLKGRKILTPLMYSDKPYASLIAQIGKSLFPDQFVPLLEYIPRDQYYEMQASCGTVIMNHIRQQGGNTLYQALYKGATVYLNDQGMFHRFFKESGLKTYGLQDLPAHGYMSDDPGETEATLSEHRKIILDSRGHDVAISNIHSLRAHIANKKMMGSLGHIFGTMGR